MWVLEYAHGQNLAYRLICSSRNLTGDRSWDAVVRLDGFAGTEMREQNAPVQDFVARLPRLAVGGLPIARAERIADLAERLGRVEWERPADVGELVFHAFGVGRDPSIDFSGRRHLVVSPFLTDEGINIVAPRKSGRTVHVVSRAESLDRLSPESLKRLTTYVLDDAVRDSEERPDDPLVGLHAKAYVLDRQSGSRVFIGSANATGPAFGGNVEFLIELVGKQSRLGVDAVFGEDSSLRQLMVPYETDGGVTDTDDEKADRALEVAIRALAATRLRSSVQGTAVDTYSIITEPMSAVAEVSGLEIQLQLLTQPGRARPLPARVGETVEFTELALTDITPFLVIRATDTRGTQLSTVVCADLVGDLPHRRDAVLARQIDSPEKFLRFLFLLLSLGGADASGAVLDGAGSFGSWASDGAGIFESLVRSLAVNPGGLDDLARLIDRLRDAPAAVSVLPDGFEQVWNPIWQARLALKEDAA
ncbi:phospholipase D family protein [Salinibacterium sp. ZJ450]|uniref:phospholipase D family protein n=1 Tax=Salinibacterium sp. ZJ450 TaxID=2708338 RepID=UPI001CD54E3A|nr:phospholipase D family protein [Salinibacterium sp. ZJ450]